MRFPGPTEQSCQFLCRHSALLHKQSIFKVYNCSFITARAYTVLYLSTIRGEEKKKMDKGGSQRKRAANRSECQTQCMSTLSKITSRHSWSEGGGTADVNVVLTDWAMCTMSVITGRTGWLNKQPGDKTAPLISAVTDQVKVGQRYTGVWTSWKTIVEIGSVSTQRWVGTMEKYSTGCETGFTIKLGQKKKLLLPLNNNDNNGLEL